MAVVLTTVGIGWTIDRLDGALEAGDYIGWGTGAGTSAAGDVELRTEASEARVVATKSQPSANVLRFVGQIVADADKTITNVGNLTQNVGGVLIVHGDVSQPVVTGEICDVTIDLQAA